MSNSMWIHIARSLCNIMVLDPKFGITVYKSQNNLQCSIAISEKTKCQMFNVFSASKLVAEMSVDKNSQNKICSFCMSQCISPTIIKFYGLLE